MQLTIEIIKNLSNNTIFDLYYNTNSKIQKFVENEMIERNLFQNDEDDDMWIPSIDFCYDNNHY